MLIDGRQACRLLPRGVTLRGEVCHVGAIALAECAQGFLFVRGGRRDALPACCYVAGSQLAPSQIAQAVLYLRCARGAAAPGQPITAGPEPAS